MAAPFLQHAMRPLGAAALCLSQIGLRHLHLRRWLSNLKNVGNGCNTRAALPCLQASGSVGGLWNYSDEVEDDLLGRDPSRRRMHSSM